MTQANLADPKLGEILGWEATGWPDFATYAPVFEAIDDAVVFGAAASDFAALQACDDIQRAFRSVWLQRSIARRRTNVARTRDAGRPLRRVTTRNATVVC